MRLDKLDISYPIAAEDDYRLSPISPDDDAATIRGESKIQDDSARCSYLTVDTLQQLDHQQRWSSSTFGNHHLAGSSGSSPDSFCSKLDNYDSDEWSDEEEDYIAEFQCARRVPQFGRSAFNLAPSRGPSLHSTPEDGTAPPVPHFDLSTYTNHSNRSSVEMRQLASHTTGDLPPRNTSLRYGSSSLGNSPISSIQRTRSLTYTPRHFVVSPPQNVLKPLPPPPVSRARSPYPVSTATTARLPPPPRTSFLAHVTPMSAEQLRRGFPTKYPTSEGPRVMQSRSGSIEIQHPSPNEGSSSGSSASPPITPSTPTQMVRSLSVSTNASSVMTTTTTGDTSPFTFYSATSKEFQPMPLSPATNSSTTLPAMDGTSTTSLRVAGAKGINRQPSTSSLGSRFSRGSRSSRTSRGSRGSKHSSISELPSPEAMKEAESYQIYGEDGEPVAFGNLYPATKKNPNGPAPRLVVFFVRVFFCGPCQDFIRASVNKLDVAALDQANISIAIIANGHQDGIKGYKKTLKCNYPIFSDPSRGLYALFNFRMGLEISSVVAPDHKPKYNQNKLPLQMAQGFIRGMVHFPGGMGGNLNQLGGEAVIGPGNRCEFVHRMTHPRDHMEAADVVRAAGCIIPIKNVKYKSFHPVNPEAEKQMRALQSQLRRDNLVRANFVTSSTRSGRPISPAGQRVERPRSEVSGATTTAGQPQDTALYRFLADYLDSSETLDQDRLSAYSASLASLTDTDLTDIPELSPQDFKTAADYKAAVQERYATSVPQFVVQPPRIRH